MEKPIKESPQFLFEIIFGKEESNKYYEMYDYEKGKFIIKELKNEEAKNFKEDNNNNNNITNSDNLIEKEENPEIIKIKQEFFKNTVNDFKKMFVSYLEELLK